VKFNKESQFFLRIQGTINSGQFASEVIGGHRLVKEDDGASF